MYGTAHSSRCSKEPKTQALHSSNTLCLPQEWGEGTQIEAAVPASVPDGLGLAPEVRAKLGLKVGVPHRTHAHTGLAVSLNHGNGTFQVKYEDYAPHGPDYYMDETAKWSLQLRQLWEPSHDEEL